MMACREDDPIYLQLEGIKKSAERATTLTRQLLAFSRKQLLQPRVTNLNTVITDLEKMLRRLIGEDIHLLLELDPNLGAVKTDPGQIQQVIMNLVINARDAMPMGGKLTIQTANAYLGEAYSRRHKGLSPGPYAQIAVIDEGLGIDPETLAHIFEPFFTTKEANKGTGLGLFTVYGIVKQSGGHIEVASKVGEGTVFKIYLRQLQETMEESPGKAAAAAPLQGSETVLVVEDEEILLELIKEALEMHGYLVMAAHNGEEAIELCQQHRKPIDLMLTDVVMPQQNGRELAEFLAPLHPEMKTLYMSGYTEDAMVVRSLVEAALPFIQKPFPPLDLVRKVREMIDSRGN
jgi:CheY-like chemotaxis protein